MFFSLKPSHLAPGFKRKVSIGFAAALLVFATAAAAAEPGVYLGVEVGVAEPGNLGSSLSGINHPTRCDTLLYGNPDSAPTDGACADNAPRALFSNGFDLDAGFVGGVSLGYQFGQLRFEAEYVHRHHGGDDRLVDLGSTGNAALGTKDSEWDADAPPSEHISDFNANHFFLNAYYDFSNGSAWTPYLGAGVGVGWLGMRYDNRFLRRDDLGPGEWQEAAAGTISYMDTKLNATRLGFQVVGGLDYALSERVSVGAKVRWTRFDGFTKKDRLWERIRSHEPVTADGVTPFRSDIEVDGLDNWALSVGLRYRF